MPQRPTAPDASPTSGGRVIVWLRGGLGNQMFQYALGRAIAERHGRELVLDSTALEALVPGTTRRAYALDVFDINIPHVLHSQLHQIPFVAFIVEQRPGFCSAALDPLPFQCIYLKGFWQDERYFIGIQHRIRADFALRAFTSREDTWHSQIVAQPASVCLHVRRQDYLTDAGAHMGFVGKDYYDRAVSVIASRINRPHFFIFSDDMAWCERNLSLAYPRSLVRQPSPELASAANDLALMKACRHFVIANSSYSWWAAWLSDSEGKTVIAPKKWFRDEQGCSPADAPAGWLRL